jgi:hypothetical protein
MRRTALLVLLGLAVASGWWACSSSTSPSPVTSLALTAPSTIVNGTQAILSLFATSADGTRQNVTGQATWTSSPSGILAIQPDGLVTALAVGLTTITATFGGQTQHATVQVLSPMFTLSGRVTDAGVVNLVGAVVTITTNGTTRSTTSGFSGTYFFTGVSGATQLQVAADGFVTSTQTVQMTQNMTINVALTPTVTPVSVSGAWLVTFSASPDCAAALPADARQLTFAATLTQLSTQLQLLLADPTDPRRQYTVSGTIAGSAVAFELPETDYYGTYVDGDVLHALATTRWLGIFGTVAGTATPTAIPAVFTGRFNYYETVVTTDSPQNPPTASCGGLGSATFARAGTSAAHRIR